MGRLADQFAAAQARGTALMPMTVTRGGVTETVGDVRRDVDDCGFPKRPCEGQGHGTASRAGGGTRDLVCADCGRAFTQRTRRGTAPKRCPECKRARRNALRRAKGAGQAGRVAQVQALTCADCGRTFEAPVLNRPPLRCPECKRAHKNDLEITNRLRKKALRRCPME